MPGGDFIQQMLQTSPDYRYREIGNEKWVTLEDWDHYYESVERLFKDNDIVMASNADEAGYGYWYKSTERIE